MTPQQTLHYLLSPQAIRDRSRAILRLAESGKTHFSVHPEKLDEVAGFVAQVTRENYPGLRIPFHSRWGHFQAGGVDRIAALEKRLAHLSPSEKARAKLDLAMVSVLLDAGSGPGWKYTEPETGKTVARSEGLAIASLHLFVAGAFSSDPERPLQVDSAGLRALSVNRLGEGFQVSGANPLVGLEGRAHLLHELGRAIEADRHHFPRGHGYARPGNLFDFAVNQAGAAAELPAARLLLAVLQGLGPIWPGRIQYEGVNLGDVWHHSALGDANSPEAWVPFHKLSQWLTYSLIEPLEEAGVRITDVDGLTGLAEYRNGGLLLDEGLIRLRDPGLASVEHAPGSELVIEWRALTVAWLDRIAERVRATFGKSAAEMPLAKVLEGGTWHAGRRSAARLRADGSPPLRIQSDGTVF